LVSLTKKSEIFMANPVIIFGAKILGTMALDILLSNQNVVYGLLDDDKTLLSKELHHHTVLGTTDDLEYIKLLGKDCDACIAIDDKAIRINLINRLVKTYKVMPMNALHQSAYISPMAEMGHGNLMGVHSQLLAFARLGSHSIVQAQAVIGEYSTVGDYSEIGAGTIINSEVTIGENAFIGSGVTIIQGIQVGADARIGAGSVVIKDVGEGETVFGYPAKKV
jgi:sugar O-acyltransferase (sialic acid O-acetyltransferase NeuD family)